MQCLHALNAPNSTWQGKAFGGKRAARTVKSQQGWGFKLHSSTPQGARAMPTRCQGNTGKAYVGYLILFSVQRILDGVHRILDRVHRI